MNKKISFCAGFGAVYAAALYGAVRLCLHWPMAAVFYYSLLGAVLLLYTGYYLCGKWCGETGFAVLWPVMGGAAIWSAVLLAALGAGRFLFLRQLKLVLIATLLAYLYCALLLGIIVSKSRRASALAAFTLIGGASGKRAIFINRAAYVCYLLLLALPIGWFLQQSTDLVFFGMLLVWILLTMAVYVVFTAFYNNRLLTEHLDPAAFYDVNVWMYGRYRKRKNQVGPLLNIRSAYDAMDQKPMADQLLGRMANEPFSSVYRLQYQLACANSCETLPAFEVAETVCRGALSMMKPTALVRRQTELMLAGHRAQLENNPEALLRYAEQLLQMRGMNNRHNRLVAELCRAKGLALTGRAEDARAACLWIKANCGGCRKILREADEQLSLPAAAAPAQPADYNG